MRVSEAGENKNKKMFVSGLVSGLVRITTGPLTRNKHVILHVHCVRVSEAGESGLYPLSCRA